MQTVSAQFVQGKKVLLRLDFDVDTKDGKVTDDFRLRSWLPTLQLCLDNAESVIMMGHIGRPMGREVEGLSVGPIVTWLKEQLPGKTLPEGKLSILENLRFEDGEDACDMVLAKELAEMGDVFVNEAFAAHHPSASTTLLPTLVPSAAGLHFTKEVEYLTRIRQNPKKPFVAIIGGAKILDKLPAIKQLATVADHVLVGGKLTQEIKDNHIQVAENVVVGENSEQGFDLSEQSITHFKEIISSAEEVIWAGPLGKFEEGFNQGNKQIAETVIASGAESIIGGGDTIDAMKLLGMLEKFSFVSTGGGALLKFLANGTLPAIVALNNSANT